MFYSFKYPNDKTTFYSRRHVATSCLPAQCVAATTGSLHETSRRPQAAGSSAREAAIRYYSEHWDNSESTYSVILLADPKDQYLQYQRPPLDTILSQPPSQISCIVILLSVLNLDLPSGCSTGFQTKIPDFLSKTEIIRRVPLGLCNSLLDGLRINVFKDRASSLFQFSQLNYQFEKCTIRVLSYYNHHYHPTPKFPKLSIPFRLYNYNSARILTTLFFWVVTRCRLMGRYQRFGETYCVYLQPWRWR
jgi:hypothetical protein